MLCVLYMNMVALKVTPLSMLQSLLDFSTRALGLLSHAMLELCEQADYTLFSATSAANIMCSYFPPSNRILSLMALIIYA